MTTFLAVDWSGRATGAEESSWLAEVRDGRLTDLRNGLSREALAEALIRRGGEDPRTVAGLDFCFSFPRWFCERQGWSTAPEVWRGVAAHGEELLARCDPPFWGRKGKLRPPSSAHFRRTEEEDGGGSAKSVFQIGGGGAVGTGSLRGMPHLLRLEEHGFHVWPFSAGLPRVLEIYPRAFTGPVRKSRWQDRHDYLFERFGRDQPEALLERAAGSEDAFDAAVSALTMADHENELLELELPTDPIYAIEGRIWVPASG